MKRQHTTNRADSFLRWRCRHIEAFGMFWWPQLNYDVNTAETISVVFEQRGIVNNDVPAILESTTIRNFILNFTDTNSEHYIQPTKLASVLGLVLGTPLPNTWTDNTYWDYRLNTRPQNCLTADIDALEIKANGSIVSVEAAQLFDTSNVDIAMRHIFRTFKFRPNQVNPQQYLSQHKYTKIFGGTSFILFHKINEDGTLNTRDKVFTLKNDERFFTMLTKIVNHYGRQDENLFLSDFEEYLKSELVQHDNIDEAYKWLLG